ncbi:MAG: efflux RND transporter periplasmic adaptor subunit [Candidatus Eisenbacteria bacterium]|nr:efflux RND transporter periplasmic adaptor subunit [Candidatus Latescibacterota bacterium]MBD3302925.1 efflux RND transporter periplasmic adaptor subunit [Candidatus Eisenbacteria bacterium]
MDGRRTEMEKKMTTRSGRTLFGLSILLLLLGACAPGDQAETAEEVPRNVRVLTLRTGDLDEYVTISGRAEPLRGTDLAAEEGGRVARIEKEKGQVVASGQTILALDRALLEAEKRAAEAQRDLSAFNADRVRRLFEENSVSEIEMRDAETQLARLAAAADAARVRYERAATRAPYAGVVTERYVELGETVVPGQPVARIVDPYELKLRGSVSEREIRTIDEGETARILFAGLDEPVTGTVHWIGFEADPMTGKFGVEIRIENPDLEVRPGVVGTARILKRAHRDVVTVPRDAVLQQASGAVAFVVQDSVARRRSLRLGPDQGLMVIVEEGLEPGDRLVVRGQREIHDGSRVLVREEASHPDGTTDADPAVIRQTETVSDRWRGGSESDGEAR